MVGILFSHNFLKYDDLATDESTGERHYILPDGSKVPSVTTVLSRLGNSGLDAWRQRVGEEEAKRIATQAANRGTQVHNICEQYLLNSPEYKKGIMPVNVETFKKIQPYFDRYVGSILGLEVPLYSKLLKTAGRTDCIAHYREVLSIVDFKTSSKPKKEEWIQNYFIQATCYALMAEAMFKLDIPQIVIIMSVDNEDPQIFRKDKARYVNRVMEIFA